MPQDPQPFTHDTIRFVPIPSLGSYFGVGVWEGRDWLAYVAMLQDGTPEKIRGELQIGEVQNLDDDQAALDLINKTLGTNFPMPFGR
jgi:hypothetical protein